MTNITKRIAWPCCLDSAHQAFIGDFGQAFGFYRRRANIKHARRVTVPAIQNNGDVDIQNVPVDQFFSAGDAMTNDMVQRNTGGFWKAFIIEWCWNSVVCHNIVVADFIEFAGGNTSSNMRGNYIEHSSGQTASVTHFGKAVFTMLNYRFGAHSLSLLTTTAV